MKLGDRGTRAVYSMSSLEDSADRFKKSLKRSHSGPDVKRKAVGATANLNEGRKVTSPGATLPTEDRLLSLRKELHSLGSEVHHNSFVRFLIRLLEVLSFMLFPDMPACCH